MTDDFAPTPTEHPVESTDIPLAYTSLLHANVCPPSARARTTVRSLVDEHEYQLTTSVERRQARTENVLAPIKRLPPEILSEVFEHCLDATTSGTRVLHFPCRARSREAPLLLGRVCRAWRAIAHATPRLWRDVFVNVCDGRYSDELRRDALPVLQTWLAHSGRLPLRLVVLCKTERALPGLVDVFETIAAHGARWQTVHVRLLNAPVIYRLVCRAFSRCTALTTLDVTDGGQCMSFFRARQPIEVEKDVQPVRFDMSLAPLQQLSLSLAGLTLRDVDVRWATLTRLSFMQDAQTSTSSVMDYAAVLQQCTSLVECNLTIDGDVHDAPLEPFTLPRLECLELQVLRAASHTTQTGDLLSALSAPRLCALSVEDCCLRWEVLLYHCQLKAFLHTHGQSLRHFRLSTSSKFFTSEDMLALLVETPLLTELEYHPDEETSPKALLEALTPRMQGDVLECLLPRLEQLFVYWDTTETVSMVGDMIEGRYALAERGIARLRHLSCKPVRARMGYDCMAQVEHLAARLEPLCRCGLQVDWEAYQYDVEFAYC